MRTAVFDAEQVKADTRKLSSFEAFQRGAAGDTLLAGSGRRDREGSLKSFAEQRRAYLLKHPEIKKLAR